MKIIIEKVSNGYIVTSKEPLGPFLPIGGKSGKTAIFKDAKDVIESVKVILGEIK